MISLKVNLTVLFFFAIPAFLLFSAGKHHDADGKGKVIKIGLLIQDEKSLSAKYGAELAIKKANAGGGFNGIPFRLVVRSMEGPWGTGSKQAVSLIFDEEVVALVGSHDGRNAHLVEQVCAKSRTVFLSAWSGDPTLSRAFVPWYFSCVPNDLQQASMLIKEIYVRRKITSVAVVSDNDYDSKLSLENFVKESKLTGRPEPKQFFYDNSGKDFSILLDGINKSDAEAIVLLGQPAASLEIARQMKKKDMKRELFCSLSVMGERELSETERNYFENAILVSQGDIFSTEGLKFHSEFQRSYGYNPGPVAAYAYDAMNLIIEAIKTSGTEREAICKFLKTINHNGVTGTIQFDDKGDRLGGEQLIEIKNGLPVSVER